MENLLNDFTPKFSTHFFSELLFLVGERKINKIYQRKSKSADRLWVLAIIHWIFCLHEKLLNPQNEYLKIDAYLLNLISHDF